MSIGTDAARTADLDPANSELHRGTITLILGCMFSGKTTELLRRVGLYEPGIVLAVKHAVDHRYSGTQIVSHAGKAVPAVPMARSRDLFNAVGPRTRLLAVDEAHFFDDGLPAVVAELARSGLEVALTSLEPDSWGRPFLINRALREIGAEVQVRYASCARCGAQAERTQRLTPIIAGDMLVGPEHYQPRCTCCWSPPVEAGH